MRIKPWNSIGGLVLCMTTAEDKVGDQFGQLSIPREDVDRVALAALRDATQQSLLTSDTIKWCRDVAKLFALAPADFLYTRTHVLAIAAASADLSVSEAQVLQAFDCLSIMLKDVGTVEEIVAALKDVVYE